MKPVTSPFMFIMSASLLVLAAASPAQAQQRAFFSANLLGAGYDGGGAEDDEDALANFNGEADLSRGRLCYYLDVSGLRGMNAAHIHRGADDSAPVAVELATPAEDADEVCLDVDRGVLAAMAETPGNYTVDIHTGAHPSGALRGALTD